MTHTPHDRSDEPATSPDGETDAPPDASPRVLRSARLRLGLTVAALAALAFWAARAGLSVADLRQAIGDGAPSVFVFVALYAALTVAMFPGSVMTLAAGAIFGVALGTLVAVAGATLGATLAFAIGRRMSRPAVEALAGPRMRRVDASLSKHRMAPILALRLLPLIPFNVLNYAAGATAMKARHYVPGTLLGIVPGTFAFAAAGATAGDPTSPAFVAAVSLVALLVAAGSIAARRL